MPSPEQKPGQPNPYELKVGALKVPDAMGSQLYGDVKGLIAKELDIPLTRVKDTAQFFGDEASGGLGADSLDLTGLVMSFEEKVAVKVTEDDEPFITQVHHLRDFYNVSKLGKPGLLEEWRDKRDREIEEARKKK